MKIQQSFLIKFQNFKILQQIAEFFTCNFLIIKVQVELNTKLNIKDKRKLKNYSVLKLKESKPSPQYKGLKDLV